jgi:hypothetical protein
VNSPHTVALVESPAQLLHAVEWCFAADAAASTVIAVLPPTDENGRLQLRALIDLARDAGFEVGWFDVRKRRDMHALLQVWLLLRSAARIVVGDPSGGVFQAILPARKGHDAVIVDDGTATLETIEMIAAGRPLVRWQNAVQGDSWIRSQLGARGRAFFTPSAQRQVSVFTLMPVAEVPGLNVSTNKYAWLRGLYGAPQVLAGTDLVGSSLVETGLVELDTYLEMAAAVVGRDGVGRYFAHRREDPEKLAAITAHTGLEVVRPQLPLELVFAQGPVSSRVVSFPSSVGFTLPVLLAGRGVTVEVLSLEGRFAPTAAPEAKRLIGSLASLSGGSHAS